MPYNSIVESQAIRQTHVSNQILMLMFGISFREKSRPYEIVSSGNRFPVFLHFFSARRIVEVLTISDCKFAQFIDHQHNHTYEFCSYCVLNEVGTARTFKAYRVMEDGEYLVFKYNCEGFAQLVRLKRPKLSSDRSGYDLSESMIQNRFRMIEFYPCIMYLTQDHYRNFIFMSPRLCTNRDGLVVEEHTS